MHRKLRVALISIVCICLLLLRSFGDVETVYETGETHFDTKGYREAYVTLISSSTPLDDLKNPYFLSTRALVDRLVRFDRTKTNRPVIVLVTPTIQPNLRHYLEKDGAQVMVVSRLLPKGFNTDPQAQWANCFTKFHMWNLDYDTLFYLDADILPLANLDDAFTKYTQVPGFEFLAPSDINGELQELPTFNAGMMLLRPNATLFDQFMEQAGHKENYDAHFMEQGFLNWYYRNLTERLPRYYSGNWVQKDFKMIKRLKLRTVHEKYWWLSTFDYNQRLVRTLFEDVIQQLPLYDLE